MSVRSQMFRVFCGVLLAITFSFDAIAQSIDPPWTEDLTWQLGVENDCKVDKYISTHDGKIGERAFFEARLKCSDGRMLDAHRIEPQETFIIKRCEVVEC